MEIQESTQSSGLIPQPHGGALRPFQKGQVTNPGGRPKGWRAVSTAWTDLQAIKFAPGEKITRKKLLQKLEEKNDGKITLSDELAVSQFLMSLKGWASKHKDEKGLPLKVVPPSIEAAKVILDRTEGPIAAAATSGGAVTINVVLAGGGIQLFGETGQPTPIDIEAINQASPMLSGSDNTHYVNYEEPAKALESIAAEQVTANGDGASDE